MAAAAADPGAGSPPAGESCGGGGSGAGGLPSPGEQELTRRLQRLYPAVNQHETPLPRSWSPKDKYNYIGLSQSNLRVHYKGHGKNHKDAASVRATHPIPAACGIYYFEVKIVSKGRDGVSMCQEQLHHHHHEAIREEIQGPEVGVWIP